MKYFKYSYWLFFLITTVGVVHGQQKLSLQDALNIAITSNPELKSSALEVNKTAQEKVIARSRLLPSIYAGGQVNHYFLLPAFFGFGNNNEGGKIPYGRFGGKDQLFAAV